jgi:hypothetical protein
MEYVCTLHCPSPDQSNDAIKRIHEPKNAMYIHTPYGVLWIRPRTLSSFIVQRGKNQNTVSLDLIRVRVTRLWPQYMNQRMQCTYILHTGYCGSDKKSLGFNGTETQYVAVHFQRIHSPGWSIADGNPPYACAWRSCYVASYSSSYQNNKRSART